MRYVTGGWGNDSNGEEGKMVDGWLGPEMPGGGYTARRDKSKSANKGGISCGLMLFLLALAVLVGVCLWLLQ